MQLFFNESTKKNFHLSKEESKHVIKVLRKKEGDLLDFTDGNGNHQIGEVLKVKNNEVRNINEYGTNFVRGTTKLLDLTSLKELIS